MKKYIFTLLIMIASFCVDAQVNFMGIPVEGSVSNMTRELKKKGFNDTTHRYGDRIFTGQFYDHEVVLGITPNKNNEVESIGVIFAETLNTYGYDGFTRTDVIKLYNKLVESFDHNDKYIGISWLIRDPDEVHSGKIEIDTDLRYNIVEKGIEYHTDYSQLPAENHNAVHFTIIQDSNNYNRYLIVLLYENLQIKTYGDDDL